MSLTLASADREEVNVRMLTHPTRTYGAAVTPPAPDIVDAPGRVIVPDANPVEYCGDQASVFVANKDDVDTMLADCSCSSAGNAYSDTLVTAPAPPRTLRAPSDVTTATVVDCAPAYTLRVPSADMTPLDTISAAPAMKL